MQPLVFAIEQFPCHRFDFLVIAFFFNYLRFFNFFASFF